MLKTDEATEGREEGTEGRGEAEGRAGKGPRALRRRGKKMTRLRRRSSINGHWYDRETSGNFMRDYQMNTVHLNEGLSGLRVNWTT